MTKIQVPYNNLKRIELEGQKINIYIYLKHFKELLL